MSIPTSGNRSFKVPLRSDLINQLESVNRWTVPLVLIQLALIALLALFIDWPQAIREPLLTLVAVGACVGPFGLMILQNMAQKKKRIEDLQEHTRFGEFDKHRLRTLFQDTCKRLNLPSDRLSVYIVADKYMNAMMLHWGFGIFTRWLDGIYLHRQALHKLNGEELQDLMGHELGHYYRHYIALDRFRLLTLILGSLAGLFVSQLIGFENILGYVAVMMCAGGIWRLAGLPMARHAMAIEYLCDDLGAQVHNITVSINGLMRIGAEGEVVTAVQRQAVMSAHSGNLNASEIVDAITAAIPYGHATAEELKAAVEKSLKKKSQQGPSLAGFLRYMWQSDADAETTQEYENEIKKLRLLEKIPRLPWESLLPNPGEIRFDEYSLSRLVAMIESQPDAELFHTAEALGQTDGMHPPLKMRILYLWHNRHEIERAR